MSPDAGKPGFEGEGLLQSLPARSAPKLAAVAALSGVLATASGDVQAAAVNVTCDTLNVDDTYGTNIAAQANGWENLRYAAGRIGEPGESVFIGSATSGDLLANHLSISSNGGLGSWSDVTDSVSGGNFSPVAYRADTDALTLYGNSGGNDVAVGLAGGSVSSTSYPGVDGAGCMSSDGSTVYGPERKAGYNYVGAAFSSPGASGTQVFDDSSANENAFCYEPDADLTVTSDDEGNVRVYDGLDPSSGRLVATNAVAMNLSAPYGSIGATFYYQNLSTGELFRCEDPTSASSEPVDADGDGYTEDEDCDDSNADVHPGAEEVCDDKDNDCDGQTDEGVATQAWYQDADGDGYGDPDVVEEACAQPDGYVDNGDDMNDNDAHTQSGDTGEGLSEDGVFTEGDTATVAGATATACSEGGFTVEDGEIHLTDTESCAKVEGETTVYADFSEVFVKTGGGITLGTEDGSGGDGDQRGAKEVQPGSAEDEANTNDTPSMALHVRTGPDGSATVQGNTDDWKAILGANENGDYSDLVDGAIASEDTAGADGDSGRGGCSTGSTTPSGLGVVMGFAALAGSARRRRREDNPDQAQS